MQNITFSSKLLTQRTFRRQIQSLNSNQHIKLSFAFPYSSMSFFIINNQLFHNLHSYSIMKKFQDSSNYISHLRRLASIMNTSSRDPFNQSCHKVLSDRKNRTKQRQRFGQRQNKWWEQKENLRIAESIINKPGVLNFQTTQQHFQRHLRIRKLRAMFPTKRNKTKKEIVIKDIMWKNEVRMKDELLDLEGGGDDLIGVSRDELRKKILVADCNESIELNISGAGNKRGRLIIRDKSIVPITYKGKGIGTAIVNIDYK